ncbi:hypothetical protein LINGRAHAP2_LOCUS15331 [Linum grandiflorum]
MMIAYLQSPKRWVLPFVLTIRPHLFHEENLCKFVWNLT